MGANRNFSNVECINAIEEPTYFDGNTCIDVLGPNGEPVSLTDQDKN
jgi:hypothetical protein